MHLDNLKSRILSESSEFIPYLEQLINDYRFDDGEALEIALLIKKSGPSSLSDEQWYVFLENGLLPNNYVEECDRCIEHIPWSNMYSSIFVNRDHLCANCNFYVNKDSVLSLP